MSAAEGEWGVLQRLDTAYAWDCVQRLVDLGPHKIAGTEREREAADWIAAEMRHIGLDEVRLEPFPVLVRDITPGATVVLLDGASVAPLHGLPMPGSWPTPPGGIEAELLFVGEGTVADYGPELDVQGKVVLFRRTWPDMAGHDGFPRVGPVLEAHARGAVAVLCYDDLAPADAVRVQIYALGANDYEVKIPIVSLAARDARVLRARLEQGSTRVRVESLIHETDGVSHNVVGVLRGERAPDEYVIVSAHYDTWYAGATDNLSGVGALLGIARAFAAGGLRPERSLVFVAHGAEEQGAAQWLDWLIGASAFVNREHTDWVGRIVAQLNMDCISGDPRNAYVECTPALVEFVRGVAGVVGGGRQPYAQVSGGLMTYVDAAPYLLNGVPTANITFWSHDYWRYYHTEYDTIALVTRDGLDWSMRLWALAAYRLTRLNTTALRLDMALEASAHAAVMAVVEMAESRGATGPTREAGEGLRAAATTAEIVQELARHLAERPPSPAAEQALTEARHTLLWCLHRLARETRVIGGPLGVHLYEGVALYSTEAALLRRAARALERGGDAAALLAQLSVIRGPGRHLSRAAHETFLRLTGAAADWAPNMQRYTDVYPEWQALREGAPPATVLATLRPKLARAQAEADAAANRAGRLAEICSDRLRSTAERLAAAMR